MKSMQPRSTESIEYKKVLKFRCALGQGAAAFAIYIEEAVHRAVIKKHQIERRSEARFLEKEPTDNSEVISALVA